MKIKALIKDLQRMADIHGDIEVQLQNDPQEKTDDIINYPNFFIVEEGYEDGFYINLRSWPY